MSQRWALLYFSELCFVHVCFQFFPPWCSQQQPACSRTPASSARARRLARHAAFAKREDLRQRPELRASDTLLFLVTVEVIQSWTDVPVVPHHVGAALGAGGAGGGGGAPLALTVTTSASYPLHRPQPAQQPSASPQYVQYSGVVLPTQLFTYRQPAAAQPPPNQRAPAGAWQYPAAPAAADGGGHPAQQRPPERLVTYGGLPYYPAQHLEQVADGVRQTQVAELAARLQGGPVPGPLHAPLPLYSMQHEAGLYSDPAWAAAGYPPREAGYAGVRFDPYSPQQQAEAGQQQAAAVAAAAAASIAAAHREAAARAARDYGAGPAGLALYPDGFAVLAGGGLRAAAGEAAVLQQRGGGGAAPSGAAAAAAVAPQGLYSFGGELYAPYHGAAQGLLHAYR